jgi:hypothetical protein
MIDPMISPAARARPTWVCWKAHARLVTFCLRYTFQRGDDEVLGRLIQEYLALLHLAYPESYVKPKHHMIKHLPKYLRCITSHISSLTHLIPAPHRARARGT